MKKALVGFLFLAVNAFGSEVTLFDQVPFAKGLLDNAHVPIQALEPGRSLQKADLTCLVRDAGGTGCELSFNVGPHGFGGSSVPVGKVPSAKALLDRARVPSARATVVAGDLQKADLSCLQAGDRLTCNLGYSFPHGVAGVDLLDEETEARRFLGQIGAPTVTLPHGGLGQQARVTCRFTVFHDHGLLGSSSITCDSDGTVLDEKQVGLLYRLMVDVSVPLIATDDQRTRAATLDCQQLEDVGSRADCTMRF